MLKEDPLRESLSGGERESQGEREKKIGEREREGGRGGVEEDSRSEGGWLQSSSTLS